MGRRPVWWWTLNSTVTLGCIDPFEFNITASELSSALTAGVGSGSGVALSGGNQSTSGAVGNSLRVQLPPISQPLSGNIASFDLTEVGCIIQASPSFGQVRVRIALTPNTVLAGPVGSEITINSVLGRRLNSGSAFASSYTYPAIFHFFIDTYIEFRINIDLSAANASGLHSSPIGGSFTVEVTSP